jgi:YHS domain-containing protein
MKHIFLMVFMLVFASTVSIAQPAIRQKNFNLTKGVGISGYDPVSYFSNKPVKGSAAYTTTYEGVTYQFASAANLNTFKQNPAGYEPQYGGWCAYAMGSSGEKVEVDPETYKILNGKLYLFYNKYFNNTLKTWNKSEQALKQKADMNWQKTGTK